MGFAHGEPGDECTCHYPVAARNQVEANANSKKDIYKWSIPPNHASPIKYNLPLLISINPPSHICALQTSLAAQTANSKSHQRSLQ